MKNNTESHPFPAQHLVLVETWKSEGRYNAFQFALRCAGDIQQLHNEIHDVEIRLATPSPLRQSPMAPGAGPRIYQDAYLAALHEVLELIVSNTDHQLKD